MTSYDEYVSYEDKKKRTPHRQTAMWSDAGRELANFFFLNSIFSVLLITIQHLVLGDRLQAYAEVIVSSNSGNTFPQINVLSPNILDAFLSSMVMLVTTLIALVATYVVIHTLMTRVVKGSGTFQALIVTASKTTIATYLLYSLLLTVSTTLFVVIVTESAGGIGILNTAGASPMSGLVLFMMLVWGILMTRVLKQTYQTS